MSYIYMFTSPFGEYYKDVVKLLALPNHLRYRTRYELRHLSSELRTRKDGSGPVDLSRLRNSEGLVALKILEKQDTQEQKLVDSFPLRKVRIVDVTNFENTFAYFDLELLDFPALNDRSVDEFFKFVEQQIAVDNFVERSRDPFNLDYDSSSQETSWRYLVEKLGDLRESNNENKLGSSVFIRVHGIRGERTDQGTAPIAEYRYRLRGGEYYRLEFAHRYPKNTFERFAAPNRPQVFSELFFSADAISPILAKQAVQGRYDLDRHFFYCLRSMRSTESLLVLDAASEPDGATDNDNPYFPRLEIPITIEKRLTRDTVFLLLIAAALFLGGIADMLAKGVEAANQSGGEITMADIGPLLIKSWLESNLLSPIFALLGLILAFITSVPKS